MLYIRTDTHAHKTQSMPKHKNLRISLPKTITTDPSKAARKLDISVDEKGEAWIPMEEMFRVLDVSPDRLLDQSFEYSLIKELVNLEHKWETLQQFYAFAPEVFDGSDDFTIKIARHLLKHNRRPFQALALMNPDVIRLVLKLETIRQNPPQPQALKSTNCTFCGASDARLRCSACKEMGCVEILYCSKECQTQDWKSNHKKRCCKTLMSKEDTERLRALTAERPQSNESKVDVLENIMRVCSKMQLAE